MIHKILFPTDFSENAAKALKFAAEVAQFTGADLHILHAQHVPTVDVQDAAMVLDSAMYELKETSENDIQSLKEMVERRYFLKNVTTEVEFGFARDLIIDKAAEIKADLVIMGTKGSSDIFDNLLGGVTTNVMKSIRHNLMVVPTGAHFTKFTKLAFASKLEEEDIAKLDWIVDLTSLFNPELHLVHFIPKNKELTESQKSVISKMVHTHNELIMEVVEGDNAAMAIENYIVAEKIELLAMRAGDRGFFEDLFHKSVTKHVAMHTETPIIVFH
jgi:nucleotide-binding universal stress UspA family protein